MEEIMIIVAAGMVAIFYAAKFAKEIIMKTKGTSDDEFYNKYVVETYNKGVTLGTELFKIDQLQELVKLKKIVLPEDDVE